MDAVEKSSDQTVLELPWLQYGNMEKVNGKTSPEKAKAGAKICPGLYFLGKLPAPDCRQA